MSVIDERSYRSLAGDGEEDKGYHEQENDGWQQPEAFSLEEEAAQVFHQ
jgi:hypothetical protein